MYKLGDKTLESSLMEKQEGVWIDGNLNMSQQCPASEEGSCVLESLKHSSASWAREMIVPLHFVLVLQLCVHVWELHSTIRTIRVCPKEGDQGSERPCEKHLQKAANITYREKLFQHQHWKENTIHYI